MALSYYLPYILHKVAAHDIIKLREETKKTNPKTSPENIRKYFFRKQAIVFENKITIIKQEKKKFLWLRYVLTIFVKLSYIIVNFGAFFALDAVLGNGFATYGIEVYKWTQMNHTEQFDYLGPREHPKPSKNLSISNIHFYVFGISEKVKM